MAEFYPNTWLVYFVLYALANIACLLAKKWTLRELWGF